MSYIQPTTTIIFCKNVPLTNDYKHTINFSNSVAQMQYFTGKKKYQVEYQTYQRVRRGVIRVALLADNLYDCNYLMFQNMSYGAKWFYAFITGVEYVNNETSEITFELDEIQTYMFDIEYKKCFIERRHSRYDNLYFNHQPEEYGGSEFVENVTEHISEGSHYYGVLMTELPNHNFPSNLVKTFRGYANGVACGLWLVYDIQTSAILNQLMVSVELSSNVGFDAVVTVFRYPTKYGVDLSTDPSAYSIAKLINIPSSLNGYTPKNKKLLQYPYNFLRVQSPNGEMVDLRYERFNNPISNVIQLIEYGAIYPSPEAMVVPYEYDNSGTGKNNYTYKMNLTPSIEVGMSGDAYQNWWNTYKNVVAISGISAIIKGLAGNYGGMVGTTGSLVNTFITQNAESNRQMGNIGKGIIDSAVGNDGYYIKQICIENSQAIALDNFFTIYGYVANEIDYPNRFFRPNFNFIKTKNCTLTGGAPADSLRRIEEAFDDGITFWNDGDNVGNYDLPNDPT